MNHTIKSVIIIAAITSMLVLGATSMFPIMQNSFAERDTNTNTNTNSADSSSSSDATASNTNNITNSATASQSQEQDACAVAVTCPEGSTTVTPPTSTCNPATVGDQTAIPTDGTCIATLPAGSTAQQFALFVAGCEVIPGSTFTNNPDGSHTCTFQSTPPT